MHGERYALGRALRGLQGYGVSQGAYECVRGLESYPDVSMGYPYAYVSQRMTRNANTSRRNSLRGACLTEPLGDLTDGVRVCYHAYAPVIKP